MPISSQMPVTPPERVAANGDLGLRIDKRNVVDFISLTTDFSPSYTETLNRLRRKKINNLWTQIFTDKHR